MGSRLWLKGTDNNGFVQRITRNNLDGYIIIIDNRHDSCSTTCTHANNVYMHVGGDNVGKTEQLIILAGNFGKFFF